MHTPLRINSRRHRGGSKKGLFVPGGQPQIKIADSCKVSLEGLVGYELRRTKPFGLNVANTIDEANAVRFGLSLGIFSTRHDFTGSAVLLDDDLLCKFKNEGHGFLQKLPPESHRGLPLGLEQAGCVGGSAAGFHGFFAEAFSTGRACAECFTVAYELHGF